MQNVIMEKWILTSDFRTALFTVIGFTSVCRLCNLSGCTEKPTDPSRVVLFSRNPCEALGFAVNPKCIEYSMQLRITPYVTYRWWLLIINRVDFREHHLWLNHFKQMCLPSALNQRVGLAEGA